MAEPSAPRALITGLGWRVAPTFAEALDGTLDAPPSPAPEITAYETPDGAPAFGFEDYDFEIETHLPNIKSFIDRTSAFALVAALQALEDAGLRDVAARPAGFEIGCAYGTTFGCLHGMELFWKKVKAGNPKFAAPLPFTQSYTNSPSSLVCIEYGLRGPAATFSGAYTSGLEALQFARDQIALGAAQAVLVCASESLARAVHAHLNADGRLSATGALDLWAANNDGIVPGEGGVALLIECEASAKARGAKVYAALSGVDLGSGADAHAALCQAATLWGADLNGPATLVTAASPRPAVDDAQEKTFWVEALRDAPAAAVAPALFAGELFAAAPLLGLALAARVLKGETPGAGLPAPQGLNGSSHAGPFDRAAAASIDPLGQAGLALLAKA